MEAQRTFSSADETWLNRNSAAIQTVKTREDPGQRNCQAAYVTGSSRARNIAMCALQGAQWQLCMRRRGRPSKAVRDMFSKGILRFARNGIIRANFSWEGGCGEAENLLKIEMSDGNGEESRFYLMYGYRMAVFNVECQIEAQERDGTAIGPKINHTPCRTVEVYIALYVTNPAPRRPRYINISEFYGGPSVYRRVESEKTH